MPRASAISLPSSSGRTLASSSCCGEPVDALLEVVVGAGPAAAALRALRVVQSDAGQPVQPGQQRPGVGDVAAHGGVGPLPVAVAVEAQVQLDEPGDLLGRVLVEAQRLEPLARELGADELVVVEARRRRRPRSAGSRGLPMSWSSAARRSTRSGPGHRLGRPVGTDPRGRWPARGRSASARRRPCGGGARRARGAGPAARAGTTSARPVSTSSVSPSRGRGDSSSLVNSSRTRSAETIESVPARSVIGGTHLGRDVEAELRGETRRPHHPQRVVGEGLLRARPACVSRRCDEVGEPAVDVDELEARAAGSPSR